VLLDQWVVHDFPPPLVREKDAHGDFGEAQKANHEYVAGEVHEAKQEGKDGGAPGVRVRLVG
jgi:hypothetical protein